MQADSGASGTESSNPPRPPRPPERTRSPTAGRVVPGQADVRPVEAVAEERAELFAEAVLLHRLHGACVAETLELARVDLDHVRLQPLRDLADPLGRLEILQEPPRVGVERDQDRQHAVLDQPELARNHLEGEQQVGLAFLQASEDLLPVEAILGAGAFAPVDLSEEVFDGIERERIGVASEDAIGGRGAPVLLAQEPPAG